MTQTKRVWTPANIITMARIGAFPFILLFSYLEIYTNSEQTHRTLTSCSMLLFVIAFLSDTLDGYLARKRNEVTTLGKFLDPLSDKIVVVTALLMLVMLQRMPAWIALLIILREIVVTALRTLASDAGLVIAASVWGKAKTVVQVVAISFLLFHFPRPIFGLVIDFHFWGSILIYLALAITLWSGWEYFRVFFKPEVYASDK
jgi:CDP-diacylglycerol---glycerol-3-phosphate 3-phosphatidyltransferase